MLEGRSCSLLFPAGWSSRPPPSVYSGSRLEYIDVPLRCTALRCTPFCAASRTIRSPWRGGDECGVVLRLSAFSCELGKVDVLDLGSWRNGSWKPERKPKRQPKVCLTGRIVGGRYEVRCKEGTVLCACITQRTGKCTGREGAL